MALRPPSYLDETDASPDLTHGVPGLEFAGKDSAAQPAKLRKANMPTDDKESYVLYVALIFGIALVLRVLVLMMGPMFGIETAYTEQTAHQMQLAENLAAENAFGLAAQPEGSVAAQLDALRAERGDLATFEGSTLHPEFYEAPGYPALLWIMNLTGLPLIWLLAVQCVLGAACVPLVYRIGLGLVGRKMPSAIAAIVVALHPALILSPSTLAADTVVVLLVLLGLFGVAEAEKRGVRSVFAGGLAIGGATLLAPMTIWLAPLLASWVVITERRLKSFALAGIMIVGAALPAGAWMKRNIDQGYGPYVTAGPTLDRVFGTLAAAQDPEHGPYGANAVNKGLILFQTYAAAPEYAEVDTLVLLDRFGRLELSRDLVGQLTTAIQATAPKFALDHSLDQAYARLGLEYFPGGYAAQWLGEDTASSTTSDAATAWVVNAWVALNAAMVVGMALGAALMLWRRRWDGLVLIAMLTGFYVLLATTGPSETLRLPLIALQGLAIAAIVAPGPLRVKKPKKVKARKAKKLDEPAAMRTGSPLATEESLRPAAPAPVAASAAGPVMGSGEISLKDAIHPALSAAPPAEATPPPTTGDEAKDFAASVQDERLKNLATSGRPI